MRQRSVRTSALALLLCAFYLLWTLWAILLIRYPVLDHWQVRLAVRIAVWGGSTLAYNRLGGRWVQEVRFTRRGLIWGVTASSFCIARLAWRCAQKHSTPTLPDFGTIANAVIAGPVLEELVFRAIIFRELTFRIGVAGGVILSAFLFALIHVPYWWLAHAMAPNELLFRLSGIVLLGIVLALIYRGSGTLFAPIILHVLNNATSLATP